ncbi:hypothetical protein XENORESO_017026, partial [Xenotaenia resolanae]
MLEPQNTSASMILDSIRELRLDVAKTVILNDPTFIQMWFGHRLRPFLPAVSQDFLSCLTTKTLNCSTYQSIVQILGEIQLYMMNGREMSVFTHFIRVFLTRNNTAEPQCISSASQSADWVKMNFGFFSRFASLLDFYELNPHFSGLEAMQVLSSKQLAEMLLLPLRTPPERDVVIHNVFDFLLESPKERQVTEVLDFMVQLAREVNPPCSVYKTIFDRLFEARTLMPPQLEPAIWAGIDELMSIATEECVPVDITCPDTRINSTYICRGIN